MNDMPADKNQRPNLIVMLTHNDLTIENAEEVFLQCKDSKARYWGFKESPLPMEQMHKLFLHMKECDKTTVLEVVAYDEASCVEGAQMAVACGCDILMGTKYYDSVADICRNNNIKYMPFVGTIDGRPSVLSGSIDEIREEVTMLSDKGVFGVDLLAYRYINDPDALIASMVNQNCAEVCVAGSIDSYDRLDYLLKCRPWGFTIGSAFFEHKFGTSISEQIDNVIDYLESHNSHNQL